MKKTLRVAILAATLAMLSLPTFATTWFDEEFTCPIDGEKNIFKEIGSYGTYIYFWESKYQWVFWPKTDSPTYYMCKKCHYSAFMWDFDKLPKDKIAKVKEILATINAPKTFKSYLDVPVTVRLAAIEKIYAVLDKDEAFWEEFQRVKAYHYAAEGMADKALDARKKSLEMTQSLIKSGRSKTPLKVLWYVSGAMRHFTGDDKGALEDLQKSLETKFTKDDGKPEDLENMEKGFNERIADYITRIKSDKKPRDGRSND